MKKILILGSLPKNTEEEKKYQTIIDVCKKYADKVKSPIDTANFNGSYEERYQRAFEGIQDADLIIGEQSLPSTGQGMEIRECAILKKPIFVVAKKGSKVSGLVKGCPLTKKIIYYENLTELEEALTQALSAEEK